MKKLYIPAFEGGAAQGGSSAGSTVTTANAASWGKLTITKSSTSLGLIKEGSVSFNDNGTEQTLYSTGHIPEALKKFSEVEIAFQLILPDVATLNSYVDSTNAAAAFTFTPDEGSITMTANNAILTGTPMWAEDTGFYVDAKLRCTPPSTASGKTFTFAEKSSS